MLGLALRECNEDTGVFTRMVSEGLRVGDARYGRRFMEVDNLVEAQDESKDAACYLILELERLRGRVDEDTWDELRMAATAGVLASYRLHQAIRVVAGVRESRG